MSGLNHDQNEIAEIAWEPEEGVALPPHQESIRQKQKVIQLSISSHLLVDKDRDWSDIEFKYPRQVSKSRPQINEGDQVNKNSENLRRPSKGKILANQKPIGALFLKGALKFLDYGMRALGAVIKFLFIFLLHLLGIKKVRRTRRRKVNTSSRYKKRNQKFTAKNRSTRKTSSIPNKSSNANLKWKEVDAPFIPSSNLYCYWCTKKLGLKSWELDGHYYCESCRTSKNVIKR